MKSIILILLLLVTNNHVTKEGIADYVNQNKDKIVKEFETSINDRIYSYNIIVDDLSLYQDYDSMEAGRFYPENEIIITDELKYVNYEYHKNVTDLIYVNLNKYVKAVVIHELMHLYLYQLIDDLLLDNYSIHYDYIASVKNLGKHDYIDNNISNNASINLYGASFIEEGICEYIVCKMKQSICDNTKYKYSVDYIKQNQNTYEIKYIYSRMFLQDFLNQQGLKQGLLIILSNAPPTYIEMANPELYYSRL